jgi:hypothetical protein
MIDLKFNKMEAERHINSLLNSRPISPPNEGWSNEAIITLAGACSAIIETFARKVNGSEHLERVEAREAQAKHDTRACVGFVSTLCSDVIDNCYDERYADRISARIQVDGAGRLITYRISGFKQG